jgi:hypothetical protein
VVGVEVRDEDLVQVDEPDGRAKQLALRSLGAVEKESVASAPHEQRRRSALRGRHRARRPQEHKVEIHGPILGSTAVEPCLVAESGS